MRSSRLGASSQGGFSWSATTRSDCLGLTTRTKNSPGPPCPPSAGNDRRRPPSPAASACALKVEYELSFIDRAFRRLQDHAKAAAVLEALEIEAGLKVAEIDANDGIGHRLTSSVRIRRAHCGRPRLQSPRNDACSRRYIPAEFGTCGPCVNRIGIVHPAELGRNGRDADKDQSDPHSRSHVSISGRPKPCPCRINRWLSPPRQRRACSGGEPLNRPGFEPTRRLRACPAPSKVVILCQHATSRQRRKSGYGFGRGGALAKPRNAADRVFHLLGGDQPGALELPRAYPCGEDTTENPCDRIAPARRSSNYCRRGS